MSQNNDQVEAVAGRKSKQKQRAESVTVPIRIRQKTKARLEQLLRQTNKDRSGRKVKADDLICFSLELLTEQHLTEIGDSLLSNKDRLELLFQQFVKGRRGATREEFLGELLKGKALQ